MRKLFLAFVLCLWSSIAFAAVAVDDAGVAGACDTTNNCIGGQSSPVTFPVPGTVTAASNPAMLCAIGFTNVTPADVGTVTWKASGAGTDVLAPISGAVKSGAVNGFVQLFGGKITAGATNGTVQVTFTNNGRITANCMSFKNVDQTTPFYNGTNTVSAASSTSVSVTPTTGAGDAVVGFFLDDTANSNNVAVNGVTLVTSTSGDANAANYIVGSGTLTGTFDASCCTLIAVGAAVKAAAGAAVGDASLTSLGVGQ